MKLFSEREGFELPKVLQIEGMDQDLRNAIWNILYEHFFKKLLDAHIITYLNDYNKFLVINIWSKFFKLRIDEINEYCHQFINNMKNFIATDEWHRVYSFLEFLVPDLSNRSVVIEELNKAFEAENSGYRFINYIIAPISNETEIKEIKEASENPLDNVNTHIKNSILLLSEKKNPNYANAVKEAISAVEALCKTIVEKESITLGGAIKEIEQKEEIHLDPLLIKVLKSLWAYTSDSDGIRHALKQGKKSSLSFEESKFLIVICSALVNYLYYKANKAGIA